MDNAKSKDKLPKKKNFITKDSGKREEYKGGSIRDKSCGKPKYNLLPPLALKRVANLYARGAEKYKEHNWCQHGSGIPFSRLYESALRHLMEFGAGENLEEDTLSACVFNILAIIHFQEIGRKDLDDMFKWKKK